jgi:predicted ATP-grasp superfamily ATP-dependent carboligase
MTSGFFTGSSRRSGRRSTARTPIFRVRSKAGRLGVVFTRPPGKHFTVNVGTSLEITHSRVSEGASIQGLVLDGHLRQALAVVRSLGRAGATVGSAVCRHREKRGLSLRSRWCALGAIVPNFSDGDGDYVAAVLELIDRYGVKFVLPSSDGSIAALRTRRDDVERRTRLVLAPEQALRLALDKTSTLRLADELGIGIPRTIVIKEALDLRAALDEVGYPAVIKPIRSWVRNGTGTGSRLSCRAVKSRADAERILEQFHRAGGSAIVQEWLPGRRDAVSLFYVGGTVRARFAQTSYRESPLLGGSSVLCESIPALQDIVEPAERLVRTIGLECCSMVEFRRDSRGRPRLMEVNARLGGSMALAVAAGVDFPRLVQAWALGQNLPERHDYRVGVRRRWLRGEVEYLKHVFRRDSVVDLPSRPRAVATFCGDFLFRPSGFDVFAASDLRPFLLELEDLAPRLKRWLLTRKRTGRPTDRPPLAAESRVK